MARRKSSGAVCSIRNLGPAMTSQQQLPETLPAGVEQRQPFSYPPGPLPWPFRDGQPPEEAFPNTAPQSSMRLRVNKACERCRSHKVKCLGTYPCGNCARHKARCKFRGENDKKFALDDDSDEGPTKAPPHPSYEAHALPLVPQDAVRGDPLYTQYLENRVHYLESLMLEKPATSFRNIGKVDTDVFDLLDLLKSSLSKWRLSRRHQNALVIEFCKTVHSSLSPAAQREVQIPRTQFFGWNMSGCNYLDPEQLPKMPLLLELSGENKFLVDYYFREINPLFAVLHETVFREQLQGYHSALGRLETNTLALFSAMLCLVYCTAIRFTEFAKPQGPSMARLRLEERLFKYSHRVVQIFSFEWELFELIQCWVLITLYLRVAHRQTLTQYALANAVSMCHSMGLGVGNHGTGMATPYEFLKAKRVWFMVYCLDRIIGLQSGRYRMINDADVTRAFPTRNYDLESEGDDWITLPAFAMIHIARAASFMHTALCDNYDMLKLQQIEKEITLLSQWLELNGFANHDIFPLENDASCGVSSQIKAQVKLHFHDMVIALHGKLLFSYLGKHVPSEGARISRIVEANEGVAHLMQLLDKRDLLYVPWHLNLLCLFNVGVNCVVFLNAGVFVEELRRAMKTCMELIQKLSDLPVFDNGVLVKEGRFKMVRECLWALKMCNRILLLSLQQTLESVNEWGTDHGPLDVNRAVFTQFGRNKAERQDDFDRLLENQNRRYGDRKRPRLELAAEPEFSDFLGNLQWFDQWLDFSNEL